MIAAHTLWSDDDRRSLIARLRRLEPHAPPLWGRLTAPAMVAHLVDASQFALGERHAARYDGRSARLLRTWPVSRLLIYVAPFPRHAPSVPELFATAPSGWPEQLALVASLLERVAARARSDPRDWPAHPFFGTLPTRAWGVLGWRHTDHHLRQFGV